jgi:drug/metabolite transporter (DMT)-like permease
VFAGALVLLYRALALGPLAVVSPIVSGNTMIAVVLVIAFAGSDMTSLQTLFVVLTIAGLGLAGADLRALLARSPRANTGVPYALAAMLVIGVSNAALAVAANRHAGLAVSSVTMAVTAALVLVAMIVRQHRWNVLPRDRVALVGGVVMGALNALGFLLFLIGVAETSAPIVVTLTGLAPLLPALLGVLVHGERPAPNQYAGSALIIFAVAGLSVA